MKLRYYLRGLGVGILLATVILTAANRDNRAMSDAEVRARAAELGMVESGSMKLSELSESVEGMVSAEENEASEVSEAAETLEAGESSETSSDETAEESAAETDSGEEASAEESSAEPSSEAAETAESSETSAGVSGEESTEKAGEAASEESAEESIGETVTFEIRSGSGSETVSRNLEAAGLVADASDFDDYLCDNGYSRKIRVGTYKIPTGSTEEEIARIITGG